MIPEHNRDTEKKRGSPVKIVSNCEGVFSVSHAVICTIGEKHMRQKVYSKDVILILAASFFYFSSPMLVTPLIAGFSGSVGGSATLMGIIGGLMNLCSLFCRPFVGNLADKISKYGLTFIGAGLMAFACLGYMIATGPVIIIISRIINGIGFACCSVCMATWMSNMLPREKIGSGMGLYGMMNALGMAVAPAVGIHAYQIFGYRTSFGIALVISFMTMIIIQFIGDKGQPERSIVAEPNTKGKTKWQFVDWKVVPIALIIMLFAIPYCATQSFLVSYVQARNLHVSVSFFFPLYAVILLILRLSMKNLFDRLPFQFFLIIGSISAFLGILFLAFMNNNIMMFLASLFMAGGYGIMCSVCQSTAILIAGKERRGLANSTYYIGLDLGMALGPFIGGLLYGNVALPMFYPALLVTVPVGIVVYLLARKRTRF